MKKVSIIVPVYGVEKYIEQCLDSLLNQSYSNIEIVVVDDGSNDSSGIIADSYAIKDKRVKTIHINNRGAAGARNVGLDVCSGDYIMFVDSDDWVEPNAVEVLLNSIITNECDIVQCQFVDEYINKSVPHELMRKTGLYTSCEFVEDMLINWEDILLWNKLFSARVLDHIRLEEGHCIDDEFFTYKVLINAEKIEMIDDYLYHYRNRRSSAMKNNEKYHQRLRDQIDFVTKRYEPLCSAYPQLKDKILQHLLGVLLSVMNNSANYPDIYAIAKKELSKYGKNALLNHDISLDIRKSVLCYLIKPVKQNLIDSARKLDQDSCFD